MPWKGLNGKNSQTVSHHCDEYFQPAWLIGLVAWWVPIWHCWRALVSNHISSLIFCKIRETDQQPGQKSIWAKSHLLKSSQINALAKTFRFKACSLTNAFPHRNGCKRVVDLNIPLGTLFKKNTKRKMHGKHVVISFRFWKLWGYMVATL